DAMHDLVVDGEADAGRKRLPAHDIPLEGRLRLLLVDPLLRDRVEIGRRDTGAHVTTHLGEDLRDDPARRAHTLDLVPRLEEDHCTPAAIRPKTSSRVPTPSASRSKPAAR